MNGKVIFFLHLLLGLLTISIPSCQDSPSSPPNAHLEILTPSIADPFQFRAIVTIENKDSVEWELEGSLLEQLDWAVEMKDGKDSILGMMARPAIPDPAVLQAPPIRIEPGKSYSQNINRLKVDWTQTQAGPAKIRFKAEAKAIKDGYPIIPLVSDWYAIEVVAPAVEESLSNPPIVTPEL